MSINKLMIDVVLIYNVILLSHKKEWIRVSCSELDEPRASHRVKSKKEKQVSCINAYMWNQEKQY